LQRTRELGIRLALGAQRSSVLGLVVKQAARLAGLGLVAGTLASLALSRAIASLLYGVSPVDPLTYVALASLPNFKLPGDLSASNRYWAEDIVEPPFELGEGGMMAVPYRWGLGVRVKTDMVDRLTVRREVIT